MTRARAFRLAVGVVLTVGALAVLFTALEPIWNGHPAYPTTVPCWSRPRPAWC
jgi:hypothetical protein